eukprot:scaffold12266_cov101-Isochrysis_galbana.AAC.2
MGGWGKNGPRDGEGAWGAGVCTRQARTQHAVVLDGGAHLELAIQLQAERLRVQRHAAKAEFARHAGRVGRVAVPRVAEHRVARQRGVLPNLMRAARVQAELRDSRPAVAPEHLEPGLRIDAVLRRALRVAPALRLGGELLAPQALRLPHAAAENRTRLLQRRDRLGALGDQHHTRRLNVEPVGRDAPAAEPSTLEQRQKREGAVMHRRPTGFVDDEPVSALGDDQVGHALRRGSRRCLAHDQLPASRLAREQERGEQLRDCVAHLRSAVHVRSRAVAVVFTPLPVP